jgi:hypothetical protein
MSRRRPRESGREPQGGSGREASQGGLQPERQRQGGRGGSPTRRLGFLAQLVVLALAFGLGVGVAEAAGAANLGTAFGIGQIVFAITLVFLLLRA